jgi:hypothetical protein
MYYLRQTHERQFIGIREMDIQDYYQKCARGLPPHAEGTRRQMNGACAAGMGYTFIPGGAHTNICLTFYP